MIVFKNQKMKRESLVRTFLIFASAVIVASAGLFFSQALGSENAEYRMKPETVANYLHAIIEADRTLYALHVIERMQETGTVIASEGWKHRNALPLPAQMLMMAGQRVEEKGLGLQYRLVSLWPIYEKNGVRSAYETEGLETLSKDPTKPYYRIIEENGRPYFKAIYADLAVSKACVNCHNTHLLSTRRDYKLGDVMGGLVISFSIDEMELNDSTSIRSTGEVFRK